MVQNYKVPNLDLQLFEAISSLYTDCITINLLGKGIVTNFNLFSTYYKKNLKAMKQSKCRNIREKVCKTVKTVSILKHTNTHNQLTKTGPFFNNELSRFHDPSGSLACRSNYLLTDRDNTKKSNRLVSSNHDLKPVSPNMAKVGYACVHIHVA